jgi:hypothetical protein
MFIRFSGESLKLRNSSFLGPNRMNNLLKAHISQALVAIYFIGNTRYLAQLFPNGPIRHKAGPESQLATALKFFSNAINNFVLQLLPLLGVASISILHPTLIVIIRQHV